MVSPLGFAIALCALAAHVAAAPRRELAKNDDLRWNLDVTHSLTAGSFIKMGKTILTKFPYFLKPRGTEPEPSFGTLPSAPNIGDRAVAGNTLLNTFVGAAHAYCYGLTVKDAEDDYAFRVCTAAELNALTAVMKVPAGAAVLTYSSADGNDYVVGQMVSHPLGFEEPPDNFVNGGSSHSYGAGGTTFPPSPPLPSAGQNMQSFSGAESDNVYWKADAYIDVVTYCCSGKYTLMNGEGATCFGGGSMVHLSNGSSVPIELVSAGDFVSGWSSAEAALSGMPAKSMRVGTTQHTSNGPELYGFRLGREGSDSFVIPPFVTGGHALLSKSGWVAVDQAAAQLEIDDWVPTPGVEWAFSSQTYTPARVGALTLDDKLLMVEDGVVDTANLLAVDQIKDKDTAEAGPDVYSLELEDGDDAVYIVNGLLVIG